MTAPPLPRREQVRLEVEPWKPPLNSEAIAHAAERIRVVQPLDVILDDIGDVLTDQLLAPAEFGDHSLRLRGGLNRLVSIATAAGDRDEQVVRLVRQSNELCDSTGKLPADNTLALGHLRRMANVALALMERLGETGTMKEVA
ncbi:DUF6415 family natural product biosynthesis protein [Streptomyces sp. NPDC005989]|uniref:DUF6415 family natural product biosynthesis protein n=1 Tax=Streptomyces sp. NPDC005989 TaxID=3156727 RepID=UPI0033CA9AC5